MAKGTSKQQEEQEVEQPATKKKMSSEEAQAIVDKYSGINGSVVPEELKQARAVLAKD